MANIDSVKLPNGNEYNLQDVVTPRTAASQPNLFFNPWFTVNQRGFTSATIDTTHAYTVDRWRCAHNAGYSGTVSLSNNILTVTSTSGPVNLFQSWESYTEIVGKELTFSLMESDGTIGFGTLTFDTSAGITFYENEKYRLRYTPATNAFQIEVQSGKSVAIKAVKLEIGSTSTLHLDTAPDYSTEFLKCARYYWRITAPGVDMICEYVCIRNSQNGLAVFKYPVPMRALPQISLVGTTYIKDSSNNNRTVTVFERESRALAYCGVSLTTSSSMVTGLGLLYFTSAGDYIEFNSEL